MPIYTKTGDDGTTALFGGKRTIKSDPQVEAYGIVDELTSFLGLIIGKLDAAKDKNFLTQIQKDLYVIMAVLSGKTEDLEYLNKSINKFEQKIDYMQSKLPKLNRFILPQGTEISALLHMLRTVCRRAERSVVFYNNSLKSKIQNHKIVIRYLNRLSDLFFVYARWYNKNHEVTV